MLGTRVWVRTHYNQMSEAIQIDTRSEETKAEDAKAETQIENFVPPTPTQEVAEPPAETPPPAK